MARNHLPMRTTADGEQVGAKMHSAVVTVAQGGPMASKNQLAKLVGPNGSQDYGYRIVDRCVAKDLIVIHPGHEAQTPSGLGALRLTQKGARYLNEHADMDLNVDEYVPEDVSRFDLKRGRYDG